MTTKISIPQTEEEIDINAGGKIVGLRFKTLAAAGVAAAGAITLTGAAVGDQVLAVFGTLTAGGPLIPKTPGTDFEASISVVNQVQQLAAADLHTYTYIFLLSTQVG